MDFLFCQWEAQRELNFIRFKEQGANTKQKQKQPHRAKRIGAPTSQGKKYKMHALPHSCYTCTPIYFQAFVGLSGCAWSLSKSCISKYSFEYSYEFLMFIWLSSCAWLFSKLSVSNYSHSHFYRFRNIPMSIRWCLVARKVTDLKLFLYTFL